MDIPIQTSIFVIYMWTCTITSKSYIGQTNNIKIRTEQHIFATGSNCFHDALKKYGIENFILTIIFEFESDNREERRKKEMYFVKKHNTVYPNGYNSVYPCAHNSTEGKKYNWFNYSIGKPEIDKFTIYQIQEMLIYNWGYGEIALELDVTLAVISNIKEGKSATTIQNGEYKIPESDIIEISKMLSENINHKDISLCFNISMAIINKIKQSDNLCAQIVRYVADRQQIKIT